MKILVMASLSLHIVGIPDAQHVPAVSDEAGGDVFRDGPPGAETLSPYTRKRSRTPGSLIRKERLWGSAPLHGGGVDKRFITVLEEFQKVFIKSSIRVL